MRCPLYVRGRKCHLCGRRLYSHDSYSIRHTENGKKEIVTCFDCEKGIPPLPTPKEEEWYP